MLAGVTSNRFPAQASGKWLLILSYATRYPQGDDRAVSFRVTELHLNAFPDGRYRITPSLKGNWRPSGLLAALSYRAIEPISASVALTKDDHIQSVEFEVVRRGLFSGRRLGT